MNHCPFRNCTFRRYRHRLAAELQLAESWTSRITPMSALCRALRSPRISAEKCYLRFSIEQRKFLSRPNGLADRTGSMNLLFSFSLPMHVRFCGAREDRLRMRAPSRSGEVHQTQSERNVEYYSGKQTLSIACRIFCFALFANSVLRTANIGNGKVGKKKKSWGGRKWKENEVLNSFECLAKCQKLRSREYL